MRLERRGPLPFVPLHKLSLEGLAIGNELTLYVSELSYRQKHEYANQLKDKIAREKWMLATSQISKSGNELYVKIIGEVI